MELPKTLKDYGDLCKDEFTTEALQEEAKKWVEYYEEQLEGYKTYPCQRDVIEGKIQFIKAFFGV